MASQISWNQYLKQERTRMERKRKYVKAKARDWARQLAELKQAESQVKYYK